MANEKDEVEGNEKPAEAPKKGGSKIMVIIIGLVVLILIAGGVLFFTPLGKKLFHKEEEQKVDPLSMRTYYYKLPDLLVNLMSEGTGKRQFLSIGLTLEVTSPKDVDTLESIKPKIVDQFQLYLRSLKIEDLSPSPSGTSALNGLSGLERVREELLVRVNAIAAPAKVTNVLFTGNLLVQ